jgi:probable rRNA maturation factor
VRVSGRRLPLSPALVRRVVNAVLRSEHRQATISVTFVGREAMRKLNVEHKGHDRPTDVLTFALTGAHGETIGDIYICPWVARRESATLGISLREELIRLIVHGTLHALGRDHPEGIDRTRSAMWRRQERYVEALR